MGVRCNYPLTVLLIYLVLLSSLTLRPISAWFASWYSEVGVGQGRMLSPIIFHIGCVSIPFATVYRGLKDSIVSCNDSEYRTIFYTNAFYRYENFQNTILIQKNFHL